METILISTAITVVIGIISYQQKQIHDIVSSMKNLISRTEVSEDIKSHTDTLKEKINDRVVPITEQLARIEDKVDDLVQLLLTKRD